MIFLFFDITKVEFFLKSSKHYWLSEGGLSKN